MTVTARLGRRDPVAARSVGVRWLVVLATLVGLVGMHQLAGGVVPSSHHHAASAAVSATAAHDHCPPHPGSDDCPDDVHRHPGQMCQPGPGGSTPTGVPALTPVPAVNALETVVLSSRTAATDAAEGSGCGPPSLAELSLLRI
jgi:hypothetical protein